MNKIKYKKISKEFLVREYADGIIIAFKAVSYKVDSDLCNSIHDFVMDRNGLFAPDIVDGIEYNNKDNFKNILLDSLFIVNKNKYTISGYNIDCIYTKDEIVINYYNDKVLTIYRENRDSKFLLMFCIGIIALALSLICLYYSTRHEKYVLIKPDIIDNPTFHEDSISKTDSLHKDITDDMTDTIIPQTIHDDFHQDNIVFKTICEKQVCVGEVFQVTYELCNDGKDFKSPHFTNFEIIEGPSISTSSSVQTINGSVFKTYTKLYQYRLKAIKEGTFTIPQATAHVNNKIILSDTCSIIVKDKKQSIKVDSIVTNEDIKRQKLLKDANYYLNKADKAYYDYAVSENDKCAIEALVNYEKVLKIIDGRMIYSQKKIQYINDCIETLKNELY